jgi:uridine phosphorylase
MGGIDFFSDDPTSVVVPEKRVSAFAEMRGEKGKGFCLEAAALVTFLWRDLKKVVGRDPGAKRIESWNGRNFPIYCGKGWIAAQSPFGAPNAAMFLEELAVSGVRRVVYLGYCGSLQNKVEVGDVVLPTEAIREEGTSYHYLPGGEKSLPDQKLREQLLSWTRDTKVPIHEGKVWTTDAPYRETVEKVRRYRQQGVLGVEMEMAALFAVGISKRISVGALLLVSDELRETGWETGFLSSGLARARDRVTGSLLGHLGDLISG